MCNIGEKLEPSVDVSGISSSNFVSEYPFLMCCGPRRGHEIKLLECIKHLLFE